jgi:hypothetical protein
LIQGRGFARLRPSLDGTSTGHHPIQEAPAMAEAQHPPLSDYDQTMALFLEFLQELRN